MAGLTDGEALANIGARNETKGTDESSSTVGEDITVQVGGDDDVVGLGLAEELVDHGVDDLLLGLDGGEAVLGESGAGGATEEAVGLGEDVGLVGDGDEGTGMDARGAGLADLLAAEGDFTSHGGDAVRSPLGDALDGLGDLSRAVGGIEGPLLLDVEVLGVLTDNDHVDGLRGREDGFDGTHVGVQVKLLAQGDDGGGVALDGGGGGAHGTEEGAVALLLEDLDGLVGEGGAGLLEGLEAGFEVYEVELEAEGGGEGLEDTAAGGDDLFADAIAGDETCEIGARTSVSHTTLAGSRRRKASLLLCWIGIELNSRIRTNSKRPGSHCEFGMLM